ncbi:YgfZ/GcvT domain-containing protein [Parasphingorhabdus sp.]|uniref:CAF17-like 4Fe-4S cluster assembly/insertion protein YgfZ n=1 Tax=Parasphingorhabdus sp. TaxID=2709688 RepID=UPI003D2D93F6
MNQTRLNQRAIIRLRSRDGTDNIQEFLQGLITQDVHAVQAGKPQWSALLSAQGKTLFDFFLWADGDDILVDCEKSNAEALTKRLKIYRLRQKIDIEIDESLAPHWDLTSDARPADPRHTQLGYRWLEPAADSDGADDRYLAHRLSLGVTEGQAELGNDKTLWLECNATELNGVSFTKGCYVGQENTARMNYRQKVNRRLVVVPLDRANEKRQRYLYESLGKSIEHRRIDDLAGLDLPQWLSDAL